MGGGGIDGRVAGGSDRISPLPCAEPCELGLQGVHHVALVDPVCRVPEAVLPQACIAHVLPIGLHRNTPLVLHLCWQEEVASTKEAEAQAKSALRHSLMLA